MVSKNEVMIESRNKVSDLKGVKNVFLKDE